MSIILLSILYLLIEVSILLNLYLHFKWLLKNGCSENFDCDVCQDITEKPVIEFNPTLSVNKVNFSWPVGDHTNGIPLYITAPIFTSKPFDS